MMDYYEIENLKDKYKIYPIYTLYEIYLELKYDLKMFMAYDKGKELVSTSKKLELVTNEINSRSLEEKINFLRQASMQMAEKGPNSAKLSDFIVEFIKEFMPNF